MQNKNLFLTGVTELLVLMMLKKRDCYVYEILKAMGELSGSLLDISLNSIYTATYKLENRGMITEYSKRVGRKRTRVYYRIEKSGEEYLDEMLAIYKKTSAGVKNVISSLEEGEDDE